MRWTVAALALLIALPASADDSPPQVGDPAPDFTLEASDGKTYKLAYFKGKSAVVIAWFPRAFTGGCTAECKSFKAQSEGLKPLKVAYFTASTDDQPTNAKFAESLELDYPILSDPGKDVAKAYGVVHGERTVPERWTYYIDKEGTIRAIDKAVKTARAGEDVIEKVKALKLEGE